MSRLAISASSCQPGCRKLWGCAAGEGGRWASAAAGEENWATPPGAGASLKQLKKKKKILSRDNTLTFRKRAGCWECPSSVGFLTVPHLNILHFTLSLLCPQSVKQWLQQTSPAPIAKWFESCWYKPGTALPDVCSSTSAVLGSSGLFTPHHFRHSTSISKTSVTQVLWIISWRDGSLPLSCSTDQLAELDAKGSVAWFPLQLKAGCNVVGVFFLSTTHKHYYFWKPSWITQELFAHLKSAWPLGFFPFFFFPPRSFPVHWCNSDFISSIMCLCFISISSDSYSLFEPFRAKL